MVRVNYFNQKTNVLTCHGADPGEPHINNTQVYATTVVFKVQIQRFVVFTSTMIGSAFISLDFSTSYLARFVCLD